MKLSKAERQKELDRLSDIAGYHTRYMSIAEAEEILAFVRQGKSMRQCDIKLARFTLGID